ncbi:MAG TPA: sugar phosphate isomerase/epimerase family protein [Planctomicrobium sp.]|nr:sugar phosphate isomerase/epimerase family protein [Planctomicrobium sp.]
MPGGLEGTCSVETALKLALSHQFEALELCIGEQGILNIHLTEQECCHIRHQIHTTNLRVETLASGMSWGANPISNDQQIREHSLACNEQALQRAAWLGCSAFLYVPGVVTSPISPAERVRYDHAVERARQNISELLKTAERVGVELCLENVWNGLFYSPLEFAEFIDSFHSNHLGVYFDAGNLIGYQQHPPHWVEILGHRIKRVHVKGFRDSFGFSGSYEFCELGDGDVPLQETIQSLQDIGYDSTIIAEMLPYRDGLLKRTANTLNQLLNIPVS